MSPDAEQRLREGPATESTAPSSGGDRSSSSLVSPLVSPLLFLLSSATLALQIVQVRVFSYSINPVYVYMVISLAMLGIGASGTVLSLVPGLRRVPLGRALSLCLLGFAATGVLANLAFARLSGYVLAESGLTLLSPVTAIFALFVLPYFFSGLGVALVLVSEPARVSRNYFVNLVGSGSGCFVVYPFLGPMGAPWVILAILSVCAAAAAGAWIVSSERARAPVAGLALAIFALLFFADRALPFQPDQSDFYQLLVDHFEETSGQAVEPALLYEKWDPVGKVEIFEFPKPWGLFSGDVRSLFFAQDAGAPSHLFDAGHHPRVADMLANASVYGLATTLRPEGEVLVMGLGGGPDLIASLAAGRGRVTGIEINEAVIDALDGPFRDFLGLPAAGSERLSLVHSDGRAFARRFAGHFDVIQMTGADTYAAGSVSGSILSENYLYTVEAFHDYLDALRDDGILAVTRFGMEPIKIATTAATALRERGAEDLRRRVITVRQGAIWVLTLVKKTPFTPDEIRRVRAYVEDARRSRADFSLPTYDEKGFSLREDLVVLYDPGLPDDATRPQKGNPYAALLGAADRGELDGWLANARAFDFHPSTDDRPFFLQMSKLEWPSLTEVFASHEIENPLTWSITNYFAILVQIAFLALLLILGPLFVLRRRGVELVATAPVAVYFLAIGMGFMFVEIGLMQRFTLFLGHPNFAISTVLFTLLVFSGLGSLSSGIVEWSLQRKLGIALFAIVAGIFVFSWASGPIFSAFLDAPIGARIAISVVVLAPISFFMGMPLPNLLRLTEERYPAFSPWALGVNGFASVLASLATIPLTVAIGFTATFHLGALCYAIAWLAFQVVVRLRTQAA